jgi:putative ABC transport system substrate-binding protein
VTRRELIAVLTSTAAAGPLGARAQQAEQVRRIGVLMNTAADNLDGQARFGSFLHGLQKLGWADGRNVRIDVGWAGPVDLPRYRKYAAELVARGPDVILATTTASTAALQQATRTMPIVFAMSSTRSEPTLSKAYRGRAATPQALCSSNTV